MYIGLLGTPTQANLATGDCYGYREKLRDYEATYLWFNQRTISEFSSVVESILDRYSESEYPSLSLSWRSIREERPYRKVNFSGYCLSDPEESEYLDQNVLMLANGLPNREFQFAASRNDGGYQFKFEARSIPYDDPLVRFLYSNALESSKCGNSSLREEVLKNTRLTVEKRNLVISTHLTRDSLARLRQESLKN